MATAIDPVCKMEVDTDNPNGGQSEHQGQTYYFCAPGCRIAFDKEPEAFLSDNPSEEVAAMRMEDPAPKPGLLSRLFGRK